MEKFRKLILFLIIVIMCVAGIIAIFKSDRSRKEKIVREYEKCLTENFFQRSDCARSVSNYTYWYLDNLRESFK